ncbi:RluA family pseudouridine synthase [Pueribacillus theae]|uniref:Pseudouridine synthase n=1 Tax=Pueribacillus theae TaxID=2171751 RepID=A0A2U1K7C5_9BACI|nr:RluA family pseudouridine synthase [Pueribacillus theae]PWA13430.1 RluA family pseudouridine synthase [Pueribacillus theae]
METFHFTIDEQQSGQRIDKLLSGLMTDVSRSRVQELIDDEHVMVNGELVKASYKCQASDNIQVVVPEPEPLEVRPETMDLDIIYEDADVLVVNKPRGMVVHPAPGHMSGTLVNGLLAHCNDLSGINGVIRPGIVHRIDKDTSGLLMVAKNDQAHDSLVQQLKAKTTVRKYKAIVHGSFEHNQGTIDAPIGRDENDRKKMAVTDKGREAITHFRVLERFDHFTFVECQLVTGRTHQIRVHMKYIDHPVAGDPKYGPRKTLPINGQALHAEVLGFKHPRSGEKLIFSEPVPDDMETLLHGLRNHIY